MLDVPDQKGLKAAQEKKFYHIPIKKVLENNFGTILAL